MKIISSVAVLLFFSSLAFAAPDPCQGVKIDDGNPCTTDKCINSKVFHTNNFNPCNDNSLCTKNDICKNGKCEGTPAKTCLAGSQCDPKSGACVSTVPASKDSRPTTAAASISSASSSSSRRTSSSSKTEKKANATTESKKQQTSAPSLIGVGTTAQKTFGETVLSQTKISLADLDLEKLLIPHGGRPDFEKEFLKEKDKFPVCKTCLLDTEKTLQSQGTAKAQEEWTHFGLPGTGVISSVDCYVATPPAVKTKQGQSSEKKDTFSFFEGLGFGNKIKPQPQEEAGSFASKLTCLAATEGSGLYKTTDLIKWEKLEDFPDNAVKKALIDPVDSTHYVAASFVSFSGIIRKIYHSYDAGKSWAKQKGQPYDPKEDGQYNVYDIAFANGSLLMLAQAKGGQVVVVSINTQKDDEVLYTIDKDALDPAQFTRTHLKMSPNGSGLISTKAALHMTKDYGKNWQPLFDLKAQSFDDLDITSYDISKDGKVIVVSLEEHVTLKNWSEKGNMSTTFAYSQDGGKSWNFIASQDLSIQLPDMKPTTKKGTYLIQDLILLDQEQTPGSFLILSYMNGPVLCEDWGVECKQEIKNYGSMVTLKRVDEDPYTIFPQDLRLGRLALIQKKDFTGNMENLLLIPTDQGLFALDLDQQKLWNAAKDLWLGDTGRVQYGNCRLYSGLWHGGGYWVNLMDIKSQSGNGEIIPLGTIEGHINGEHYGYSAKDISGLCHGAAFAYLPGYMIDGRLVDAVKSTSMKGTLDDVKLIWSTRNVRENQFYFHEDGWWYGFVSYLWEGMGASKLIRIKDDMSAWEEVDPDGTGKEKPAYVVAFGLQGEAKKPGMKYNLPTVWILAAESKGFGQVNYSLWKQTTQGGWEMVQANVESAGGKFPQNAKAISILADEDRLFIATSGSILNSADQGKSFTTWLNDPLTAMTQDKCGRIYVAQGPNPGTFVNDSVKNMTVYSPNGDGGVFYSENYGKTFQKLGTKDTKSYITSLTVDHMNDVLYAGTAGESILKIQLKECEWD